MRRAAHAPELLDGPLNDPAVLRDNLRDMGRANRLTGGAVLSRQALDALIPAARPARLALSLLDVGTGGADIPVALLADARQRGRRLRITAVDSRPEVLAAARAANPGLDEIAGLKLAVADGRSLPYSDAAFDVAHASLVLHHLEPLEAVSFVGELARVARRGIVLNDLSRRRIALLGALLLSRACTRNRFTRSDAPLSVRRAYTEAEATALVIEAGLRPVSTTRTVPGYRWAIAAVSR